MEDSDHTRDCGYTLKGTEYRRNQSSGIRSGVSDGNIRNSRGGRSQNNGSSSVGQVRKGEKGKELTRRGEHL